MCSLGCRVGNAQWVSGSGCSCRPESKQTHPSGSLGVPSVKTKLSFVGCCYKTKEEENIQDHAGGGEGGTLLLEWSGKSLQKNPGTTA